jgi:hypothetical protein
MMLNVVFLSRRPLQPYLVITAASKGDTNTSSPELPSKTIATEHGLKDGESEGCQAELFIQPWKITMFKPGATQQDMTALIQKLDLGSLPDPHTAKFEERRRTARI